MPYTSANNNTRKKFLTIVLVLAVLLLLYGVVLRTWFSITACVSAGNEWIYKTNECRVASTANKIVSVTDFEGVSVQVPEQNREVQLTVNLMGTTTNPSGSWGSPQDIEKGSVILLLDKALYVKENIIVPMVFDFGGSGSFVYLGLFTIEVDTITQMGESFFVGNSIAIESLESEVRGDGHIGTVYYLEHGRDQSYAERPEQKASKKFILDRGVLSELE